jgi:hypothetical protein
VTQRRVQGDERFLAVGLTPEGAALRDRALAVPRTMLGKLVSAVRKPRNYFGEHGSSPQGFPMRAAWCLAVAGRWGLGIRRH